MTLTGQIIYKQLEGGFYGFVTNNGDKYMPSGLKSEYLQNGLIVELKVELMPDMLTFQQFGDVVKVLEVKVLDTSKVSGIHESMWFLVESDNFKWYLGFGNDWTRLRFELAAFFSNARDACIFCMYRYTLKITWVTALKTRRLTLKNSLKNSPFQVWASDTFGKKNELRVLNMAVIPTMRHCSIV